jgi:DNA-binding MarR family transcriptional regulator
VVSQAELKPEICTCHALRQAARHVTQFYDQFLAPVGLRVTQLSILAKLKGLGAMPVNALARELVMDRTTLGRNMLPLAREGLIAIMPGSTDRRSKELHLTSAGAARLKSAVKIWERAQAQFATAFGSKRTVELRALLREISVIELGAAPTDF